jgi:hypothetical protein
VHFLGISCSLREILDAFLILNGNPDGRHRATARECDAPQAFDPGRLDVAHGRIASSCCLRRRPTVRGQVAEGGASFRATAIRGVRRRCKYPRRSCIGQASGTPPIEGNRHPYRRSIRSTRSLTSSSYRSRCGASSLRYGLMPLPYHWLGPAAAVHPRRRRGFTPPFEACSRAPAWAVGIRWAVGRCWAVLTLSRSTPP